MEDIFQSEDVIDFFILQRISSDKIDSFLLKLKKHQYQIIEYINQGSFGIVFKATNKDKIQVAIKLTASVENSLEFYQQQVHNLKQVDSPYVIKLLDHFFDDESKISIIVTEYARQNLTEYLMDHPFPEEQTILKIFKGIINGIIDIHKAKIIHSNLKPSSILLDKDYQVKICSFALSIQSDNDELKDQKGQTIRFCAPEQLMGVVGFSSDIYSAGNILQELCFSGKGYTNKQIDSSQFPEFAYIIERMKQQIPNQRMKLQDVLKELG